MSEITDKELDQIIKNLNQDSSFDGYFVGESVSILKQAIKSFVTQKVIDELESLQAADMRLYTNPVIEKRLAQLTNNMKGKTK